MKRIFFVLIVLIIIFSQTSFAKKKNTDFDMLIVLTQQECEYMDWWNALPAQFGPEVSGISKVFKGEYFKIMPIFNHYATTSNGQVDITYDMKFFKPDGSVYMSFTNCIGFKGENQMPNLIPSVSIVAVCFDPEDVYGEYTVTIIANDHVKNQKVEKSEKIKLLKFKLPEVKKDDEWFFNYPVQPKPSVAIASFLNLRRSCLDKNQEPIWAAVWFYKLVFEENKYLLPHLVKKFKKATEHQKENIVIVLTLLNKSDLLPALSPKLKKLKNRIEKTKVPDPYLEIHSGEQLDILWAEFFATSRIKPIRRIISSLNLSEHLGTLDKVKSKELDIKNNEVRRKAMLEAVFQSALWSLTTNCEKSALLFRYCVGLYESNELNKKEKRVISIILEKVSENK
jgi:hypothetical protein